MEAEVYTNDGKGTVLENSATADQLEELFEKQKLWESKDLNDLLGWQFSQAVYTLRQRGLNIVTLRLGPREFAYELREGVYEPKRRKPAVV